MFYNITSKAARYIACDSHAHLVSKDGSVISRKSPSAVFKWSGISCSPNYKHDFTVLNLTERTI